MRNILLKNSKKVMVGFVTFLIIGLLIIAGPAKAFELGLGSFDNDKPIDGEVIELDSWNFASDESYKEHDIREKNNKNFFIFSYN